MVAITSLANQNKLTTLLLWQKFFKHKRARVNRSKGSLKNDSTDQRHDCCEKLLKENLC